ncbi:hypothetical protein EMIHUDRAFT_357542, partial [Emiliania huxleyi CCMP1516]|uniref:Uncharacterized protein n=2 Tax=Emiliania huxleyi TaxID=2903 RepID=A0A0D3IKI8_EMIH1
TEEDRSLWPARRRCVGRARLQPRPHRQWRRLLGPWHLLRLGHGDEQSQLLPKKVEALTGQRVVAVSAGAYHSLAITADGAVWSWGWGASGRLGHGDEQNQWQPKKLEAFAWGKG